MTNPMTELYAERAAVFTQLIDGASDRWDDPTPCEGWTVRDVVGHVIETQRDFLERHDLLGSSAPALDDPDAVWREHLADVTATLSRDGVAERDFDGYFGPATVGGTLAEFYGWDLLVHGWDVARATGQAWPITEEEAEALAADADGWGDALYGEGICAAPVSVPDDASAQDRLLGRLGRDPDWQPPGA